MFCLNKINRLFVFRSSKKVSKTRIEGDTVGGHRRGHRGAFYLNANGCSDCVVCIMQSLCVWCVLCNLCLCIFGVVRDLSLIRVNSRGIV